jgi:hypothetical protein
MHERNNALEDAVLLKVAQAPCLEHADDAHVVGAYEEVGVLEAARKRKLEAKLDGKHLGPANVAAIDLPARRQLPGLPLAVKDNAYAKQG